MEENFIFFAVIEMIEVGNNQVRTIRHTNNKRKIQPWITANDVS